MFTGLIQDVGTLRDARRATDAVEFRIETDLPVSDFAPGESVAVNGACLTVTRTDENCFYADVGPETLDRTSLGRLRPGAGVHLERALRVNERLGGHVVLGHVDAVARVVARRSQGDAIHLQIELLPRLMTEVVEKGSIALDGVSLTVNSIRQTVILVTIVPHTLRSTLLGRWEVGREINVETDIMAKHVRRMIELESPQEDSLIAALRRNDYLVDGDD